MLFPDSTKKIHWRVKNKDSAYIYIYMTGKTIIFSKFYPTRCKLNTQAKHTR